MATLKRVLLGLAMLVLTPLAAVALAAMWISWAVFVLTGEMEFYRRGWTFGIERRD